MKRRDHMGSKTQLEEAEAYAKSLYEEVNELARAKDSDIEQYRRKLSLFQLATENIHDLKIESLSPHGVWYWDLKLGRITLSQRWARILAHRPGKSGDRDGDKIHFYGWHELVHPDDLTRVKEELDSYLLGDTDIYQSIYRIMTGSGDTKWVVSRDIALSLSRGRKPAHLKGLHLEIQGCDDKGAAILSAEDVLNDLKYIEAIKRFENSFDFYPSDQSGTRMLSLMHRFSADGIFFKDMNMRYRRVNMAMRELLGLSYTEIEGRTDQELFGEEAGRDEDSLAYKALEVGEAFEKRTRKVRGRPTTFVDRLFKWRDDIFEVIGIMGISTKIAETSPVDLSEKVDSDYVSPVMRSSIAHALLVSQSDSNVLLTGESGSGKDFLANFIHAHSARCDETFLAVNCGSFAADLVTSELFGHEKGAFTGAIRQKTGKLKLADGGTLFLNEITETTPQFQAALLSFLDTRTFTRVGGEKEFIVDVRLIAATNKNLEREVAEGKFRWDLFSRLNVIQIKVPSLRERIEDMPILVKQALDKFTTKMKLQSPPEINDETMKVLCQYHWPGNVRELFNVIERALILTKGARVDWDSLPDELKKEAKPSDAAPPRDDDTPQVPKGKKWKDKPTPDQLLRIYTECLVKGGWTKADVAKVFGRKSSSTVTKWFPQQEDFEAGEPGRRSDKRDLEALRSLIEDIMR